MWHCQIKNLTINEHPKICILFRNCHVKLQCAFNHDNLKAIWTVCRFKSNSQLLGTKESYLLLYSNSDCNSQLNISFLVALSCIEGKRLSEGLFILCCDFFAVYHLLIFEAIAVPHNTLVLFGSYGIVLSKFIMHYNIT